MNRRVCIASSPENLVIRAAEQFLQIAQNAVATRGRFVVALSGGSTPKALHKFLAGHDGEYSQALCGQMPWLQTHVFLGDERYVPADHPDSNYLMAQQTLLEHVPVPAEQIHSVKTNLPPAEAAVDYASQISAVFNTSDVTQMRFDLILLGLGDDGHTASLFPGSDAVHNTEATVLAPYVEKFDTHRITFGRTLINAAQQVTFLIQGEKKQAALARLLADTGDLDETPSRVVNPTHGALTVMVDAAAVGEAK